MNKKNGLLQILAAILVPIVIYIIVFFSIFLASNFTNPIITILCDFALLTAGIFLGIKLIRKKYTTAGIIILSLLVPLVLITLVFGGCFIMIGSY